MVEDLHIWAVGLNTYAAVEGLEGLPSTDYQEARRMSTTRSGRRLLARRHALRRLVSEAAGHGVDSLEITRDEAGRPRIVGSRLDFNVSASGAWALIGIREGGRIGVDLERVRPVPEAAALAGDHFTPGEEQAWQATEPTERDRAFLACWTRKEAVAKALGIGVAMDFAAAEVGLAGAVTAQVDPERAPRGVTVYPVAFPDPLVGAVALYDELPSADL